MPRRSKTAGTPDLFIPRLTTAPCVPAIEKEVEAWRRQGPAGRPTYPGTTDTTRLLLQHWFHTEHRPRGRKFRYHDAQRESVETLVWLYEVAGVRRQRELVERFATRGDLRLLQHDTFARYAVKMATGSGKTKVMALVAAWQFFNRVAENRADYAATTLVIAPNVIVFERLKTDFADGRIFRTDPVVPDALRSYWDLDCYVRGDGERAGSLGALYVTNVQQLYETEDKADPTPDPLAAMLGPRPTGAVAAPEGFADRIVRRGGPALVLNDEAHHTHDEASVWNETVRALDARLRADEDTPGVVQFDFSATPRHSGGALFAWTVYDYPLKRAINDGVVKRPVKGIVRGIQEQPSDVASIRYGPFLTAGVKRWQEYRDSLDKTGRTPLLFVMMNKTSEADDVADWLRTTYPADFGGEGTAVIHTNLQGDVSKGDLDTARRVAREVDEPGSPVRAIVSVMMLREGWDVQGVTVVVGLRPYTATANILPEQAIGRGLRLMFRDGLAGFTERVDIIGNKAFMEFVEQLEKEEELELDSFEVGKDRVVIEQVYPVAEKAAFDIAMPQLSPILTRKRSLSDEIAALDLPSPNPPLPLRPGSREATTFHYEGLDILTLEKLFSKDYEIDRPQTAQEVIGFYARLIAADLKLPSQFAALAPRVRAFLEVAFGVPVDLDDPDVVQAIAQPVVGHVVKREFAKALRPLLIEAQTPTLTGGARVLSETPGFPWSRPTLSSPKTVFNVAACSNKFELAFARFLDGCDDVRAFAKLPDPFGFSIPYTDTALNLRYYEPDFVAVLTDGAHVVVETKGREDVDVQHKDRAAAQWCEHATDLTGTSWTYIKVQQAPFESMRPEHFEDLLHLA